MPLNFKGSAKVCWSCLELDQLFNRAIKKAHDLNNKSFESKLKQKREWLMKDIYQKDCAAAKKLYSYLDELGDIIDEIDSDSELLDGKQWEQILDVKFKPRTPIPALPQDQQIPRTKFNNIKLDELDDIIDEIESGQISFKWANEKEDVTEPIKIKADYEVVAEKKCSHEWFLYQGAGTKPPEVLCKTCGITKN